MLVVALLWKGLRERSCECDISLGLLFAFGRLSSCQLSVDRMEYHSVGAAEWPRIIKFF